MLRAELDAERELRRRLELRLAELERCLSIDSPESGTPSSKERAGLCRRGFDAAMLAALAGEKALAAGETPVNVLDSSAPQPAAREEQEEQDPEEEKAAAGAPHVLIVRTSDGRRTWLQALASRRKADVARRGTPSRSRPAGGCSTAGCALRREDWQLATWHWRTGDPKGTTLQAQNG